MATITSQQQLTIIKDDMFHAGRELKKTFDSTSNLQTLRASVSCYRTSMQASRDLSRYKVPNKK